VSTDRKEIESGHSPNVDVRLSRPHFAGKT
jgi:hypothetical protein